MKDIQLSENFFLSELIKSDVAIRHGIDNYPLQPEYIDNLRLVAKNILQPCRDNFGPITPNSGYRNPELNRIVGSKAENSQHLYGQAVDFEASRVSNYGLALWIRDNIPVYDQLILECYIPGEPSSGWVHCSITAHINRKQCLTYTHGVYSEGLIK